MPDNKWDGDPQALFARYAKEYIEKGWDVVPLPPRKKRFPPKGWTGRKNKGKFADELQLQKWFNATSSEFNPATGKNRIPWAYGNIGYHPGAELEVDGQRWEIIGIDIDDYGDKDGWDRIRELESRLGKLPDTWTSSSRTDLRSGIRWYRVPYGHEFKGKVAESIEVVQHVHRYGVVWPSIHPDTGALYYWYEPGQLPNGRNYSDEIPDADWTAELPQAWFEYLLKGVRQLGTDPIDDTATDDELKQWANETFNAGSKMCKCTKNHIAKWLKDFEDGDDHHDPLVNGHWNLFCLGTEGHTGVIKAINLMEKAWMQRLESEGESGERTLWIAKAELGRSRWGALRRIKAEVDNGKRNLATEDECLAVLKPKQPDPDDTGYLPPEGTQIDGPSKPSKNADWLLARWEAQGRPLMYKVADFYQYNGTHWEKRSEQDILDELYPILDRCMWIKTVQGNQTPTPFDPDQAKLKNLLHALKAKSKKHHAQKENTWLNGDDTVVIPCLNGLISVTDKTLLPHTPDYFCTYVIQADYDPTATCPKTDKFMKHLASGDKESVQLLYEWMGYVVAGTNVYQKGLIIKGKSGCGKGVYSRLLDKILGGENYVGFKVADFAKNTFSKEPLVGKSLAVFSDNRADFGMPGFVDLVLEVIGQDATAIRLPYERRSLNVYLPCRFMILTNLMPSVGDDSGAFVRRFVAVDCKSEPQKAIGDYENVLYTELSGIVNRMLQGMAALAERGGFKQPDSSAWILDTMRESSSLEHEFVNDHCEIGPPGDLYRIERDKLHAEYTVYCSVAQQKPLMKKQFVEALVSLGGIEVHKRGSRKEGQKWYVEGLRLKQRNSRIKAVSAEDAQSEEM